MKRNRKSGQGQAIQAAQATKASRGTDFWVQLEDYNRTPAPQRAAQLQKLGIAANGDLLGVLTKSHFVIPGKTRFECQRCGECCRYARSVATFTYEACPFLSDDNLCQKHERHYRVCRWFPFYVVHDPRLGDLLTVKPYCTGYGKGALVNYDAQLRETNALEREPKEDNDGAVVIHEVILLPDKGEWFFPSRSNVDSLLGFLAKKANAGAGHNLPSLQARERLDHPPESRHHELIHAQHYTSGLLGSQKDPQFTVNESGVITDANEPFCALCGRSREALLKAKLETLFVNPEGLTQCLHRGLAKGRIIGVPERLAISNSEVIPVLLDAMTFRDRSDGLVHGLLVCVQPVSATTFNNLLQSQKYARGLLEASLDLLVFLDVDGTILDVNETTVKMTGKSREELIDSDFRSYFSIPGQAERGIALTLSEGQVRNFELELLGADNSSVPVQFNASVYRNFDGFVQGIFAAARDVREIKGIIAELRAAQDYSRGLIESGLDLMVTVSRAGIITDVNAAAIALTGMPRECLIGAPFVAFFDDPERARAGVERSFVEGKVRNYELRLRGPSDTLIPVSFNASVYRDRGGKVQGVFGIARDIRERLKMVRESEAARIYARSLIESCPDMMVAVERDGRIADVNEAAIELTGKSRDSLVGSRFESHFVDPEKAQQGVRQAYATGAVRRYELDLIGHNGITNSVSINASQFLDADGHVAGVIAIARTRDY